MGQLRSESNGTVGVDGSTGVDGMVGVDGATMLGPSTRGGAMLGVAPTIGKGAGKVPTGAARLVMGLAGVPNRLGGWPTVLGGVVMTLGGVPATPAGEAPAGERIAWAAAGTAKSEATIPAAIEARKLMHQCTQGPCPKALKTRGVGSNWRSYAAPAWSAASCSWALIWHGFLRQKSPAAPRSGGK